MAKISRPRRGSLQFWPRKRAKKILPSANWKAISEKNDFNGILGFIGYKVGMISAYVKDMTEQSMTKSKKISVPATIIECPPVKIFSVRFYKNGKVMTEVLSHNLDKELKKIIKFPKNLSKKIDDIKDYDDVSIIAYSAVKNTGIKKKPDMIELGLGGNVDNKISFIKEKLGKEIHVSEVFEKMKLADIRGVTKGKGLQGPVKRYGISLKSHKSEKGVRRPGSLGPWHPARVIFRTPMAGQTGMFTRVVYNNKIIDIGASKDNKIKEGFKNFGNIKTDYIILAGSVQGPQKRALILTYPVRATKKQSKKNYELIELR
ncbi:MAG: 50S ribosomal protein L3 [Candidatus Pacearchaeota archaeon]